MTTRLESILNGLRDNTSFGIAVFDDQCRYLEVNVYLALLNGLAREEHRDRAISNVVPELGSALTHFVTDVFRSQRAIRDLVMVSRVPAENKGALDGGALRNWLVSFYPVTFSGRSCVVHTVLETTERTKVESTLAGLVPAHCFVNGTVDLTSREQNVLDLIRKGCTTKDIAALLAISGHTVANHRKHLCRKLNIHSTAELASYARDQLDYEFSICVGKK